MSRPRRVRRRALAGLLAWAVALLVSAISAEAAIIPVTNTDDMGAGSLRAAITAANGNTDPDVIDATGVSGTIGLISALPDLSEDVEIRGPGASRLTVRRLSLAPQFRIFTVENSEAKLSGLTITNGDAGAGFSHGGGIHVNAQSTLTVENSVVSGNTAFGGGGGISNGGTGNDGGTVTIRNSTVSGNTTGNNGGGIENAFGTMTLRNSTVSGNTSSFSGGGITHRGTLTIQNSTVSGNQADDQGGGITSSGNNTVLTVRSSTVSANNAPDGANLHDSLLNATATLQNTILSSPQGGGANCFVGPPPVTLTSNGYNLASDATCKLTEPTDQPSTNPGLAPLASNGGPTRTMALLPTSPAIDKGIAGGLTTDQRGRKRPVDFPWIANATGGDGSDIGAFEVQTLTPPPEPPSNEFSLGKVKKSKRKGTAKLTIEIVEGPGELELTKTKKVKSDDEAVEGEGATEEKLAIKPKGKARKKLNRKGKAKVKAEVTYTPDGGESNTKSRKIKLKKRS
jgi:hypothetical protein